MSLVYLGHTLVAGMDTVGALEERLVRLMGLSHDTKLVLYEEVKLEPVVMVDVLPARQMTLLVRLQLTMRCAVQPASCTD